VSSYFLSAAPVNKTLLFALYWKC